MYQIRSNDGDTWEASTPHEVGILIATLLEDAAKEQETKEWCSYEVYWIGPDRRLKDLGLV